jgi:sec-independent protein translocase protein TatB
MLDLGWQEFVMVGLVLVLVVGPKDMPRVLRAVAKYVGKARGMAREFQTSMMEVANQDEFNDVKKALQDAKSGNFDKIADEFSDVKDAIEDVKKDSDIQDSVSSVKDAADDFKSSANAPSNATKKTAPKSAKATKKTAASKAKAKKASS